MTQRRVEGVVECGEHSKKWEAQYQCSQAWEQVGPATLHCSGIILGCP